MSMSVSMSLGAATAGQACGARPKPSREDAAALAEQLFDKLDAQGSGALKLSDLQAVAGSDAQAAFRAMDGDGDGSVSKAEFSSALEDLFAKLDDQMTRAKLERAGGPPPPPPGEDEGYTEDEIAQMLEGGAGTDGKRGELLQRIADDFATADADGNGRVTREEAMKLDSDGQGPGAASGEDRMLQQILKLMSTYGASQATASTIEETA